MINSSGIFAGSAMGVPEREEMSLTQEEEYQIQQQRVMNNDGLLRALAPINFEDKIMGGQNFQNSMGNKLPQIGGALSFSQKINMLTGKGVNKMESEINAQNKINQILSTSNGSKNIGELMGSSNIKSKSLNMDDYFKSGKSGTSKVSDLLGNHSKSKSKVKFEDSIGFGKRAFSGININNKISKAFKFKSDMKIKNSNMMNQKNMAIKKINSGFGINTSKFNVNKIIGGFSNPERLAKTRIKQQKGLPMFGDFDGDKVLNLFDCNPLDPTKQDEMKNVLAGYAGQTNDAQTKNVLAGYAGQTNDAQTKNVLAGYIGQPNTKTPIRPTTADTMSAPRGFGTTLHEGPGNIGPSINGGIPAPNTTAPETETSVFGNINLSEQANEMYGLMKNATNEKDRAKYAKIYSKMYEEIIKTQRVEGDHLLKNKKFDVEQLEKLNERRSKLNLGIKAVELQTDKFDFEKNITQQKFDEGVRVAKGQKALTRAHFNYQKERDNKLDTLKEENTKRAYQTEDKRLALQSGKNQRAMWESRLKSGQSMLGSLIGGGDSLKGFERTVSGMNNSSSTGQGINMMTKMSNQNGPQGLSMMSSGAGGNPQNMMMMSGGMNQSEPFGSKVMSSVGQPQGKGWAQKVNESVGRNSPEQLIEAEKLQQYTPQQNEQVVEQPMQQRPIAYAQPVQQTQPVQQQVVYAQPIQQRGVNWNNMSPQQAAQYDPEYAKYMAESTEENVYRRGPYKKRRY